MFLALASASCGANPGESPPADLQMGAGAAAGSGGAAAGGGGAGASGGSAGLGASTGGTAAAGGTTLLGRPRCTAPNGVSGSPQSIEDAVALLNALPKPTSIACFLESLDRPLAAYASNSASSAQPALSSASPRVFLQFGKLWFSIVIDGDSSDRIEFGALQDDMRSIKGELKGPFTDVVAPSAPYDRILYNSGTACGLCHASEQQVTSITFATVFESDALRPRPSTHVSLDSLAQANANCDFNAEPNRCEMLSALFDGGTVVEQEFPSSMPTFF
jgi:hypothetical protein